MPTHHGDVAVIQYNPVCLNTLVYVMQKQIGEIYDIVGQDAERPKWEQLAMQRAQRINALNWGETAGVYFDYNFEQKVRRNYVFGTMFMPMWAGIASKEQAACLVANLPLFGNRRRPANERQHQRQPMGRTLQLGALAAARRARPAPLRLLERG